MTNCYNHERPDWTLLERAVEAAGLAKSELGAWMWMGEWRRGEHSYKHRETRKYAVLTAGTTREASARAVQAARVGRFSA